MSKDRYWMTARMLRCMGRPDLADRLDQALMLRLVELMDDGIILPDSVDMALWEREMA